MNLRERRLLAGVALGVALAFGVNGAAQATDPDIELIGKVRVRNGGTGAVTIAGAQQSFFFTPSISSGVAPGSIATGATGSGYVAGDTVTLTCDGCTITTNPVIVIGSVSSGAATNIQLRVPGVITGAPTNSPTFTQSSTSGVGSGLTVSATTRQKLSAVTNMDTTTLTATPLVLSLTTAQGVAATADVYILGYPIN